MSSADDRLVATLAALAHPVRMELLRQLRSPKAMRDLSVQGAASDRVRTLARQSVREHLDRLLDAGMVLSREAEREYGRTTEYTLNHQAFFALSEEMRGLARMRPSAEPEHQTVQAGPVEAGHAPRSPCLVLVKGADEGRVFSLAPPSSGRAAWVVGRRRGADVALDFDPFASSDHALVEWDGERHAVRDLPESRNGTTLNFHALEKDRAYPLRTGDVVGVGRSLLIFRG